jgi:hypothetical protein
MPNDLADASYAEIRDWLRGTKPASQGRVWRRNVQAAAVYAVVHTVPRPWQARLAPVMQDLGGALGTVGPFCLRAGCALSLTSLAMPLIGPMAAPGAAVDGPGAPPFALLAEAFATTLAPLMALLGAALLCLGGLSFLCGSDREDDRAGHEEGTRDVATHEDRARVRRPVAAAALHSGATAIDVPPTGNRLSHKCHGAAYGGHGRAASRVLTGRKTASCEAGRQAVPGMDKEER